MQIEVLQRDVVELQAASVNLSPGHGTTHNGTAQQPQIGIPPSYLAKMRALTARLASSYRRADDKTRAGVRYLPTREISDAASVASAARSLRRTVSTTPTLVLDAQTWADEHHVAINVRKSAGQAIKKITGQASNLLGNTAAILSQTATLLLDLVLVVIVSVYFVTDGGRMVRGAIALVPDAYHKEAEFFLVSVDSVLGGYIRSQVILAALAGLLAGFGSAVLGVPYALVIGVGTFFLQLLPVIGPILVYVLPMTIALLFTSMPVPLLLLGYFIIFEQVVTNVIGPRLNSKSVGIHPLEAMAAVLVGYPIAGILGAFLAVPAAGLLHILARQAYASWKAKSAAPPQSGGEGPFAPDKVTTTNSAAKRPQRGGLLPKARAGVSNRP